MNDLYRVAAELYSSSLRALEQRSMVFLVVQSLLAAGYAALFSQVVRNSDATILMLGIALLGIAFCFIAYVAGRTVSQDVWLWKKCMQNLERNPRDKLWAKIEEDGRIFYFQRHCIDRLPGQTLWIISPALFLAAWLCTIGILYGLHWGWYAGVLVVVAGLTFCVDKKHTRY